MFLTSNELEKINATADRLGISIRGRTMMTAQTLKSVNIDLNDVKISRSTMHRHATVNRVKTEKKTKEDFTAPPYPLIHLDGKMLTDLRGETIEREVILVSGGDSLEKPKFLAVKNLTSSSGDQQYEAIKEVCEDWNIISPIGAVFDTTASVTGVASGAIARFERGLGYSILWLACRHHIGETMAKHAAESLIGETKSKDCDPLF